MTTTAFSTYGLFSEAAYDTYNRAASGYSVGKKSCPPYPTGCVTFGAAK